MSDNGPPTPAGDEDRAVLGMDGPAGANRRRLACWIVGLNKRDYPKPKSKTVFGKVDIQMSKQASIDHA